MSNKDEIIGDYNVIVGSAGKRVGRGNVIINQGDENGNIILNQEMTIGYKAKGGRDCIVIGAFANSGTEITDILEQIASVLRTNPHPDIIEPFVTMVNEIKKPRTNNEVLRLTFDQFTQAVSMITDLYTLLSPYLNPLKHVLGL
jgi:hypothetical protein